MIIRGPAFVVWMDEFNIYKLLEFKSLVEADEFVLDLIANPKNRVVFKNFNSLSGQYLTETLVNCNEEIIKD